MTAKRKCKFCNERGYDHIRVNTGSFCNMDHAIKWSLEKTAKDKLRAQKKAEAAKKKEHAQKKREFYDNDLKTRKAATKLACHAYIRKRDYGKPCICCNREIKGDVHAGHYLESGNNPRLRYDEDNIHGQSNYCNTYQGGDSDDYRGNLIKKIGLERVERLESMKGGTVKRTAEDYKEIELYFKQKLKELGEKE